MNIQQANAATAVASKVVNQSAKKIAKEVITDTVVDMSFNMVMNYKYVPKDERIKAKQGFEMVCMPPDKKPDGDCGNPMQVKKVTASDKSTISASVENNLDKKIAGGIGATKWGKFLDWIVPIFAIGLGFAVIDYAINGDVADLFDEIAFDSLSDLGYLENVEGEGVDVSEAIAWTGSVALNGYVSLYSSDYNSKTMAFEMYIKNPNRPIAKLYNGERVQARGLYNQTQKHFSGANIWVGSNDFSFGFATPKKYEMTLPENSRELTPAEVSIFVSMFEISKYVTIVPKEITTPTPIKHDRTSSGIPLTNSPNQPLKVLAPGAFPMTSTTTGETVYPQPQSDGSIKYKTGTGIEINEDDVTVGEPSIVRKPDGSTTVKKAPTLENSNPKPNEDGTLPPPKDPNAPPIEIPEGETCSATLKLPKILPLFHSLSTSFPFSIPWDLKSGFDAVFSEMGNDKPEFSYKFEFNGSQKEWAMKFPAYFDSWKPFTDSVLIFVFDVGLVYAIYRLMQGGGS